MSESKFILNNTKDNIKVISTIESNLKQCDEFIISVAFITESGITPLLQILKELEEKKIPGKILTTDYLFFSQPRALIRLNNLKNIEVKLYSVNETDFGFHTKGYIFKNKKHYNIIMGSSNLTQKALTVNKEWNLLISPDSDEEINNEIIETFNEYWTEAIPLCECIDEYTNLYNENKKIQIDSWIKPRHKTLTPNNMQKSFIKNLRKSLAKNDKKGLLISATGTGKTFASAFALKEINPKKILFLVHREQIAKQAMKSYGEIFHEKTLGILSGNKKDYSVDFLFSTVQMMSKKENYELVMIAGIDKILNDNKLFEKLMYMLEVTTTYGYFYIFHTSDESVKYTNLLNLFQYKIFLEKENEYSKKFLGYQRFDLLNNEVEGYLLYKSIILRMTLLQMTDNEIESLKK